MAKRDQCGRAWCRSWNPWPRLRSLRGGSSFGLRSDRSPAGSLITLLGDSPGEGREGQVEFRWDTSSGMSDRLVELCRTSPASCIRTGRCGHARGRCGRLKCDTSPSAVVHRKNRRKTRARASTHGIIARSHFWRALLGKPPWPVAFESNWGRIPIIRIPIIRKLPCVTAFHRPNNWNLTPI